MTTSREQFEGWFKRGKQAMQVAGVARHRIAMFEKRMYEAWQASRQCIEVEPPELLTTPVKQFEFERDCQWKEAISRAGIKVKGA